MSVLDAAERLIAEDGQVEFTATRLATAAGMSIGRVYYWFVDLAAVVDAVADRIVADAAPPPAGDLDALAMLHNFLRTHPAAAVMAVTGRPDGWRSRVAPVFERWFPGHGLRVAVEHIDWHRGVAGDGSSGEL